MRAPFHLSKWYADCITEAGDVFIGYAAEVRWRALHIHYASVLECRGTQKPRSRFSLRAGLPPQPQDGALAWRAPALRTSGTWHGMQPPLHEVLLGGAIEWDCFQPGARVEVRSGEDRMCGLGYIERLGLTIPPWRLPIRELRWGRFVSESDALVWIDWSGPHQERLAFHNGIPIAATRIDEGGLDLGASVRLRFRETIPLRQGSLAETALAKIPDAPAILPGRILRVRETKWRSRAVLECAAAPAVRGWAIHEFVEWP